MMIWLLLPAYLLAALATIADGMVEGFEFDGRRSFERKFDVSPFGFWGSVSHENKDTRWFRITGGVFDFYHFADDLRSWGYRIATHLFDAAILLAFLRDGFAWWQVAAVAGYYLIGIVGKRQAMIWIRK